MASNRRSSESSAVASRVHGCRTASSIRRSADSGAGGGRVLRHSSARRNCRRAVPPPSCGRTGSSTSWGCLNEWLRRSPAGRSQTGAKKSRRAVSRVANQKIFSVIATTVCRIDLQPARGVCEDEHPEAGLSEMLGVLPGDGELEVLADLLLPDLVRSWPRSTSRNAAMIPAGSGVPHIRRESSGATATTVSWNASQRRN